MLKTKKGAAVLAAAVLAASALPAAAADVSNNIGIANVSTDSDLNVYVYNSADSFENIYNNISLWSSIIKGDVNIRVINGKCGSGDFRGSFSPKIY